VKKKNHSGIREKPMGWAWGRKLTLDHQFDNANWIIIDHIIFSLAIWNKICTGIKYVLF
jgi:hypothetical protein